MDTQMLQMIVSQFAAPLLAGFVMLARAKNPAGTEAEIADDAEGSARHALRSKLGFLVDVLWSVPEFKGLLDAEVMAAMSGNHLPPELSALVTPLPAAPPTALAAPSASVAPSPAEGGRSIAPDLETSA